MKQASPLMIALKIREIVSRWFCRWGVCPRKSVVLPVEVVLEVEVGEVDGVVCRTSRDGISAPGRRYVKR